MTNWEHHASQLARAIQAFRHEPGLARATGLRSSIGFDRLCRAWEDYRDAVEAEGGQVDNMGWIFGLKKEAAEVFNPRMRRLEEALRKIEAWQMPATGLQHPNGEPKSYAYCYGSRGEQDYVRELARKALEE